MRHINKILMISNDKTKLSKRKVCFTFHTIILKFKFLFQITNYSNF